LLSPGFFFWLFVDNHSRKRCFGFYWVQFCCFFGGYCDAQLPIQLVSGFFAPFKNNVVVASCPVSGGPLDIVMK